MFDIIRRPDLYLKQDVVEAGFCLRLQVELTQIGPREIASLFLRIQRLDLSVLSLSPERETSYFYLALLSRFHLRTETESSLCKGVF
jgi:hypothetical protein